ncbi:DUF1853 family protein [Marinobacter orientalis]|uniref:DUF1853 family protein n=1 Tax=Marinobacter orientalis TaxID=1928859 RepID=A0A7Y0RBX2_9GAMM|nr:DUF1853 family protein [Marinobacter orientalis]NMT63404.1 DUF1853 family protein [Marinobacter orientalis]TGX48470.1 DUF1853 family protein [Marinobacter orientalis]
MSQHPETTAHLQYRLPAVRHLAWMCHAPQLISSAMGFVPEKHLPADAEERLKAWDSAPRLGPSVLTEQPARRLGHYFERLYECLVRDLLGWEILLRNQPVRSRGITLGELDFVVRNPADNAVEHHEIAVKFYLGHLEAGGDAAMWYGPDSRDRLDIKTGRLISHQSRMSERPEARSLLASMGIEAPSRPRIFMPGYLFHPLGAPLPVPAGVPANHLRGDWLYIDQLERMVESTKQWIPLVKPHWLGPWRQQAAPDFRETGAALEVVRSAGIPRLFARLEQSPVDGYWQETSRIFVVPGIWPASARQD